MTPFHLTTRLTLLTRLALSLLILLVLVLTAVHWATTQTTGAACLYFLDPNTGAEWLVDVKREVELQKSAPAPRSRLLIGSLGNNGTTLYAVTTEPESRLNQEVLVYLKPSDNQPAIFLDKVYVVNIMDHTDTNQLSDNFSYSLTPDGKRLVYTWQNKDGNSFLSLLNLDNGGKVTVPLNTFVKLIGWSPEGKYLVVAATQGKQVSLELWTANDWHLVNTYPAGIYLKQVRWDAVGKRLVYLWSDAQGKDSLGGVSPDSPTPTTIALNTANTFLPANAWSPDNRHILVGNADTFDLIDIDTGHKVALDATSTAGVIWSANGQILTSIRHDNSASYPVVDRLSLSVYSLSNEQSTQLSSAISLNGDPSDPNRVAMTWIEPTGRIGIDVMNFDGSNRKTLFDFNGTLSTRSFPNPTVTWSPDGRFLVIPQRNLTIGSDGLTVTSIDGSWHIYISNSQAWNWLDGGKSLIYIVNDSKGYQLDVMDITTHQNRILMSNQQEIEFIRASAPDIIGIWSVSQALDAKVDVFSPNGAIVYHTQGSALDAGNAHHIATDIASAGEILRSPDGDIAFAYSYFDYPAQSDPLNVVAVALPDNRARRFTVTRPLGELIVNWAHCG